MAPTAEELDARTRLAEALWSDPETRPMIEQAVVKKFGDKGKAAIPGLIEREEGARIRAEVRDEIEKDRAERAAARAERELEAERRAIMDDPVLRIRPDEVAEVERLMQDKTIGTHRSAAEYLRASQQVATPRGSYFNADVPGLNGAGGDEFKGIVENPEKWGRDRAAEIINDFRAGRGSKWE